MSRRLAKFMSDLFIGEVRCSSVLPRNDPNSRFALIIAADRTVVSAIRKGLVKVTQQALNNRRAKRWHYVKTRTGLAWEDRHKHLMPDFKGYMDGSAGY